MKKTFLFIPLVATSVYADLPLEVKDVITEPNKFAVNFSILQNNYSSQFEQDDNFRFRIGAKWGVIKNLEIYTNVGAILNNNHIQEENGVKSSTTFDFDNLNLGLNYLLKEDDKYPAILTFSEIEILSRKQKHNFKGKGLEIGSMIYHSIDPIILSLTTSLRMNFSRSINNTKIQPSNIIRINPRISFAVNDQISLISGINYDYLTKSEINNVTLLPRQNITTNLGINYAVTKKFTANLSVDVGKKTSSALQFNYNF